MIMREKGNSLGAFRVLDALDVGLHQDRAQSLLLELGSNG